MDKHLTFIEIERMTFYRSLEKHWQNVLNKPALDIINLLKEKPYIVHNLEHYIRIDKEKTQQLFEKTWGLAGAKFAENTFNKYHKSISTNIRVKTEQPLSFWYEYMKNWALTEAGDRITWINQTTDEEILKVIRNTLDLAGQNGLGVDETARMMRNNLVDSYGTLNKYRAQRIVRTEVIGASNMGQIKGAELLGYNMNKKWVSWLDMATRRGPEFNHIRCHGETVPINSMFMLSGETLKGPGDPAGSAGNIINCRCTVTFEVL